MRIRTISDIPALREAVSAWKAKGERVAFVPTMGALHEGHLSLMRLASARANHVVASIFVNPKQFAPHEDFGRYPRRVEQDTLLLASAGVDIVFTPNETDMYPEDFATHFNVSGPALGLESDFRPHFFNGVAVVVCKLLNQVAPDLAVFGEKDYQQLCVIRQMVRDLNMNIEIVGGALIRDAHGVALSSRNQYLTTDDYKIACTLNGLLFELAETIKETPESTQQQLEHAKAAIGTAGFGPVDYLELRAEDTLAPMPVWNGTPARLLFAGWVGKTRLLDNVAVQ